METKEKLIEITKALLTLKNFNHNLTLVANGSGYRNLVDVTIKTPLDHYLFNVKEDSYNNPYVMVEFKPYKAGEKSKFEWLDDLGYKLELRSTIGRKDVEDTELNNSHEWAREIRNGELYNKLYNTSNLSEELQLEIIKFVKKEHPIQYLFNAKFKPKDNDLFLKVKRKYPDFSTTVNSITFGNIYTEISKEEAESIKAYIKAEQNSVDVEALDKLIKSLKK